MESAGSVVWLLAAQDLGEVILYVSPGIGPSVLQPMKAMVVSVDREGLKRFRQADYTLRSGLKKSVQNIVWVRWC